MFDRYMLLVITVLGIIVPSLAQRAQDIENPDRTEDSLRMAKDCKEPSLVKQGLSVGIPMIALSLPYNLVNGDLRSIRHRYAPHFRNHYDDYLQFVPLAGQLTLKGFGFEGRSRSWGEMLTANVLGTSIMMGSVSLAKTLSKIERPDGSARNSFPSGHTAMAFASATLLHLEYGERYPLISALGYLSATSVGVGRVLNNRHWVGDVVMGMNVGILSAELGYWFSGLIHNNRHTAYLTEPLLRGQDVRLSLPWVTSLGASPRSAGGGLGARIVLPKRKYFAHIDLTYEVHKYPEYSQTNELIHTQRLRLGLGRTWQALLHPRASVDLMAGLAIQSRDIYPSLQLSPRWQFTPRLSYILGLEYNYRPNFPYLGYNDYHRHRLYLNSGFEVRI